jgi:hypothetical protein
MVSSHKRRIVGHLLTLPLLSKWQSLHQRRCRASCDQLSSRLTLRAPRVARW